MEKGIQLVKERDFFEPDEPSDTAALKPGEPPPSALKAAEALRNLLRGIGDLKDERTCSRELAGAYVYLSAAHVVLPFPWQNLRLEPEQVLLFEKILLTGEFERALHLNAPAARAAIDAVTNGRSERSQEAVQRLRGQFRIAEAAVAHEAEQPGQKVRWLSLGLGGFLSRPIGQNRGFTLGPYFYAGARLADLPLSVTERPNPASKERLKSGHPEWRAEYL